jgi:hypothetical protein
MSEFKVKTVHARVLSFSVKTAAGRIVVGKRRYPFTITSFRTGKTARYPASGQDVEAVLSEDGKRLVSVWAK